MITYRIIGPTARTYPASWPEPERGLWGFIASDGSHQGDGFSSEAHVRAYLRGLPGSVAAPVTVEV